MNKTMKKIGVALLMVMVLTIIAFPALAAQAAGEEEVNNAVNITQESEDASGVGHKATAAAIAIGLAAAGGAIAMGMGIAKSVEGISRQPEAEGKIRTTLMLGLVFVETAIIYALIVAILVIFVL